ncbi:TetR/AcrR family transcriptional regulator [Luteimicrobium album]|nr:helix-turn-helix domain-containing protein [Luteimicrobium album]
MAGLREQWRRSAMQTIQERALDLFDERGFAAVTIEQVAAAADVSPSSVYRYFGTKEGLLVADEFDAMDDDALAGVLDPADPVGSMVRVVQRYEGTPGEGATGGVPRRRVRYFFTEPSVRTAVCAALDRAAQRVAPLLTGAGGSQRRRPGRRARGRVRLLRRARVVVRRRR